MVDRLRNCSRIHLRVNWRVMRVNWRVIRVVMRVNLRVIRVIRVIRVNAPAARYWTRHQAPW